MPLMYGIVDDTIPAAIADSSNAQIKTNEFGEIVVEPRGIPIDNNAHEGMYFRADLPFATSPIGLMGATQTSWVATTPTVTIRNSGTGTARSIYMDYILITTETAGTGPTSLHGALITDTITRYSSGGSALTTVNAAVASATTSNAVVHAGAITAAAASVNKRNQSRFGLKNAAVSAGDQFMIKFASPACAATERTVCVGPNIIAPSSGGTHTLLFYMWALGMTASPTGWISVAWWER